MFDRFYRALDVRTEPGSGLGLAIVHEIVRGHHGVVFARNREGGGAEVGLYAGSPSRAGQNDSIAASCGCGLATMRSSYSRGPRGIREQELDDYNLNLNKAGHEGTAVCCPASLSLAFPVRINPTREPKPAVAATVVANTCCRKLLSNGSNHGSKGREFRAFALI